jgi:membrane protein implicated in regulation of membrane protease activity
MESKNTQPKSVSTNRHRSQTFWQIIFPFLAALAAIGAAAFFLFRGSSQGELSLRIWADIASILLILPFYLWIFIFFLLVFILFLLTSRLFQPVKNRFAGISNILAKIRKLTLSGCRAIQKAFIEIEAFSTIFSQKPDK